MGRQRNMPQMKEQNKTLEKELSKMKISNLSDAEFKTQAIRMLKELIGYFSRIKQTQAETKVRLSEIKKNLQRRNSGVDETKNHINDLEVQEGKKTFYQNSKKKKESKKKMRKW